ncbi:MAG: HlyD family efflux transporter periplasmic adaptor subunit [Oscillospiraceae bacterium]|nr:HlyD family efflux transporter periplasmic adaptor subunit [Oscillospiraceae bacterium]
MKKKKIITITAIVLAVAAIVGAALFFANRQPSKEVMVVPVMNIYTSYWGDSKTLDGYVTAGSLQEIYMTEGGFDKIAVKEGQRVRKGDVLVEYDNTQAELMLRSDAAKINLLKSQITAFEQQITEDYKKISTLEKALKNAESDKPITPTTPPSGGSTTTPTTPTVLVALDEVDHIADAVNKSAEGVGAETKPYRLLCTKKAVVKKAFWETLPLTGYNFVIDIYDDTNCTTWLARWTVKTLPTSAPTEDWKVCDGLVFEKDSDRVIGLDAAKLPAFGALTLVMPDDLIEKFPVGDEDEKEPPKTKAEIEAEIKTLREDIDSCEKQIDTTKRDLRQAQITYEKNKLSFADQKILASIDGTVATLGDAATPVGEVFMRVQGESRFAVTLYVNELMLREIRLGTEVQLMCYESGTMASATITEIGTEPVPHYYSGGNINASTYQVTAEIADSEAQPRLGEWCQATLDGQMPDEPSDAIYLPLFVIREDEEGEYVMKADENERLQKQYISTGKSLWGSYVEIKEGVTMDDRLAFPYGKTVREGAPVVDGDYFE